MVNDGDHLLLALRKDLVENPQARAEYKAKFGKDLGCPDTVAEWAQQAAFFQTKEGDTRWGVKFEKPLYGALGYRSINFSYRHFPVYMKGLLFDKDMKPRINTPDGISAIKAFAASVEHMPKDIQGWGTPQIYPFWASGQAYSAMSFPSIVGFGGKQPEQRDQGQADRLPHPGQHDRRQAGAPLAAGGRHRLHGQRLLQESGARLPVHPVVHQPEHRRRGGRPSEGLLGSVPPVATLTNKAILDRFGAEMVKTTIENSKYAASLLLIEGNYEYFKILDNNLADVMNKNITAEEAAKRIEAGWNKVTNDIGRDTQIKIWRKGVEQRHLPRQVLIASMRCHDRPSWQRPLPQGAARVRVGHDDSRSSIALDPASPGASAPRVRPDRRSRLSAPDGGSQRTHLRHAGRRAGLGWRRAPLRQMARLRARVSGRSRSCWSRACSSSSSSSRSS